MTLDADPGDRCPKCGRVAIMRQVGAVLLSYPPVFQVRRWCGGCRWESEKFQIRGKSEEVRLHEEWESANRGKEVGMSLDAVEIFDRMWSAMGEDLRLLLACGAPLTTSVEERGGKTFMKACVEKGSVKRLEDGSIAVGWWDGSGRIHSRMIQPLTGLMAGQKWEYARIPLPGAAVLKRFRISRCKDAACASGWFMITDSEQSEHEAIVATVRSDVSGAEGVVEVVAAYLNQHEKKEPGR